MIITKTPLRISLVGGGTDIPEFYQKHGGAVISLAVDKYIYVMVNKKFDGGVRVSYSVTENVGEPDQLKHDIVREALKSFDAHAIEVVSVADIPGGGTGLGSSSSFAVGLSLALNRYFDKPINVHPCVLAEQAYHLERELCGHPVGKQDHYAAAYGGFRFYGFNSDDTVSVSPIRLSNETQQEMESKLLLFWVGTTRHAGNILKDQARGMKEDLAVDYAAKGMCDMAHSLYEYLLHNDISNMGDLLAENWYLKKSLALGVSSKEIDEYYDKAMATGAEGGKLCGAGGSGFLLFYAQLDKHYAIEQALGLRRVPFHIANGGSQIIYEDRKHA